jgi:hypothetical protein
MEKPPRVESARAYKEIAVAFNLAAYAVSPCCVNTNEDAANAAAASAAASAPA